MRMDCQFIETVICLWDSVCAKPNIQLGAMKGKHTKRMSQAQIYRRLADFFLNYPSSEPQDINELYSEVAPFKYRKMLMVANEQLSIIRIAVEDIQDGLRKEDQKDLVKQIQENTRHFVNIFQSIVRKHMPERNKAIPEEEKMRHEMEHTLETHRMGNIQPRNDSHQDQNQTLPTKMHQKYHVVIAYSTPKPNNVRSIRHLTSDLIGSLVVLKGIVTRTDKVKPKLSIGTYSCSVCGCETYNQILRDDFCMMSDCQSAKCKENGVSGKLTFMPNHSEFVSTQEITIQELPDQLQQGNIPLNLKIVLTHGNVRSAQPGDVVTVQGVMLPKRKEGWMYEQDLLFTCLMEAFTVETMKKKYVEISLTQQEEDELTKLREENDEEQLFEKLSAAIAPQIYSMENVKKALLLLLAGGVPARTKDGLRIRGELNMLLVGDPGLAKSQLLRHICSISPRGVYANGKGSSDVGLTAGVKIDPVTRDVSLQAGALVLADMGVCCIDEFDKMNEYDKTVIHEVMEQQTVSIAKAGITTTLNARTSILAAANPLYGRYNSSHTAEKNIDLKAALLSRFDLIFILLDKQCDLDDLQLARHIGHVHQTGRQRFAQQTISTSTLRNYISKAKTFEPKISETLAEMLIHQYVENRKKYAGVNSSERYITTRHLLGLIRLCQARAKLRFSNEVSKQDIIDCERLIQSTRVADVRQDRQKGSNDKLSVILGIIKQQCKYSATYKTEGELLLKRVISRGFSQADLKEVIQQYSFLGVIQEDPDGSVRLIDSRS